MLKKFQTSIWLIAFGVLFMSLPSNASHLVGGEITWKCLGGGMFQFQLKIFGPCVPPALGELPYAQLDVSGHPTVCAVPFNDSLTVVNDLSTANCNIYCDSMSLYSWRETVYTSFPIALPGTPPSGGWIFSVHGCCRTTLSNLMGGGGQGLTLRAIMYPYNTSGSSPCYDSSPQFTRTPELYTCIGFPFNYNYGGVDPDGDSLVYKFVNPLDEPMFLDCDSLYASSIPYFYPYYTVYNPLPGNAVLDSSTGDLGFFVPDTSANSITGIFALSLKITSYRCGQKVSEVFRDCPIVLVNNCLVQGIAPNNKNLPPTVSFPFAGGTLVDTTVMAGSTVSFFLQATDFQQNIGAGAQTVTLSATGAMLGNPTSSLTGCGQPVCAHLNNNLPVTAPVATSTQFQWSTECAFNDTIVCHQKDSETFSFIFKARDGYCPYSSSFYRIVNITVIRPVMYQSGDSLWISYTGATAYQWYNNGVVIAGATDSLYVYTFPGNYTCMVTTAGGCNISSKERDIPVGLASMDNANTFTLSPNPARHLFTLNIRNTSTKITDIVFSDITGREVIKERKLLNAGDNYIQYSSGRLNPGMYLVKVGKEKSFFTKKLIIQ